MVASGVSSTLERKTFAVGKAMPRCLQALLVFLVGAAALGAADWPLFRGNPLQTGVATSQLPDRLAVRWTFDAKDTVEGTAAIAAGTAYVGAQDQYLYALEL